MLATKYHDKFSDKTRGLLFQRRWKYSKQQVPHVGISQCNERGDEGASWLEQRFGDNDWSNSWRNGIFSFHHYHSITHEVLGIYSGSALVQMGGEESKRLTIQAGDIIVIPAGVGHKNLESGDLGVVGAYPGGMMYDMNYGKEGERPQADKNIAAVAIPNTDPLLGKNYGLPGIWK